MTIGHRSIYMSILVFETMMELKWVVISKFMHVFKNSKYSHEILSDEANRHFLSLSFLFFFFFKKEAIGAANQLIQVIILDEQWLFCKD